MPNISNNKFNPFLIFTTIYLWTTIEGRYYGQENVYKLTEYNSEFEESNDEIDQKQYYEKTKDSFDLYYRDAKYRNGKICKSDMIYQNIAHGKEVFQTLKKNFNCNCSYVIGNVVISGVTKEDISFLDTIEEVSGYVFIFSNDIQSVSMKSLTVIHGENPLMLRGLKFSLGVAHNSRRLKFILMPNLKVILRHNVIFVKNPSLCYAPKSVNWDSLIENPQKVLIVDQSNDSCILENRTDDFPHCHKDCQKQKGRQFCWSNSNADCQRFNECTNRTCFNDQKCFFNEITKTEECCHDQCAGGCQGPGSKHCLACRNFNNDGECVEYCPYQTNRVGSMQIRDPIRKLSFHSMCVSNCPDKFLIEHNNCVLKCTEKETFAVNGSCVKCPDGVCPKVCSKKDIEKKKKIDFVNKKMLQLMENCTVYDGNIVINQLSLQGDKYHKMSKEEYGVTLDDLRKLKNLQEIRGSMEISLLPKEVKSLSFLRNLKIIKAEALEPGRAGLMIINNNQLLFLGLQSLTEVSHGDVAIYNNQYLCFVDSLKNNSLKMQGKLIIKQQNKIKISNNVTITNKEWCQGHNRACDAECDSKFGCWGPSSKLCVRCKNYKLPHRKGCIGNCYKIPGYFYNDSKDEYGVKECLSCHPECKMGNSTCRGPDANQCIVGCRHDVENGYCVEKCSTGFYPNKSRNRECFPCHKICSRSSKPFSSQMMYTCTGPENFFGHGGCAKCVSVLLNRTSNPTVLKCMEPQSICPRGFYRMIVDFDVSQSTLKFPDHIKRYPKDIIIIENWMNNSTLTRTLYTRSICLPCHPLCKSCNDGSNLNCETCTSHKLDDKCVSECPLDFFSVTRLSFHDNSSKECHKCHPECIGHCFGRTEYDCQKCRHAKLFVNDSNYKFICNATCGSLFEEYRNSEIICTALPVISVLKPLWISLLLIVALVVIFIIIMVLCWRKAKVPKHKFVEFYKPEAQELVGCVPNMATLLLITESQLYRQEIIGSGAFGVVFKATWQPNLNKLERTNSFLKRNLSRFSRDTTIKLMVAVKVLTDISDPASNREMMEEAKVMASVDHPCCLRILAVCMTAHPQLITQFMPLGSLLEFCKKHQLLINNYCLLNWAKQIANGMEYLESKGIIHCDLAARNVLVQSLRQVKITDFGLAKILDHSEQKFHAKGGKMPIKWLAIECIKSRVFSSKSDVWAYGVTLWEMFTFGERPYQFIKAFDMLEYLEGGQRLHQPKICSVDVYTLMIRCWDANSEFRPTFEEIGKLLEKMCRNPSRYLSIQDINDCSETFKTFEDDAQKYDEFLQALVSVQHINVDYMPETIPSINKDYLEDVRNQYKDLQNFKNLFLNNGFISSKSKTKKNETNDHSDYTTIIFEYGNMKNKTDNTCSTYIGSNNNCSADTSVTNIYEYDSNRDIYDDGYLIPKSKVSCICSDLPLIPENDKIIYSCDNQRENEILVNHENCL